MRGERWYIRKYCSLTRFTSNLKNELVHHVVFENRDDARMAIFEYMEVFYNRQRLHQSLGFTTPVDFEMMANVA